MVAFEDYAEVAGLPLADLTALVDAGQSHERVWAAWALGMRGGVEHRRVLMRAFEHDHDAGVQRHVLIVLTGLGEHELVRRTAARHQVAWVRATATALLARMANEASAVDYDVIVGRSIDMAWPVRYAVADAVRSDAPAAVVRAIAGLLFDPDELVRGRMRQRVEAGDFDRAPFEAGLAVLRRADRAVVKHEQVGRERALVLLRRPLRLL